jgi:hypothetical protein
VALLAIAVTVGAVLSAIGGLVIGIAVAVSIAATGNNQLLGSIVGGVGLVVSIGVAVGLLAYSVSIGTQFVGGTGFAGILIGFGLARFRVDALGDGAIAQAIGWILRATIVIGLVALVVVVVRFDFNYLVTSDSAGGITELLAPTTETGIVAGFVVVSWLAFAGVWIVMASLPPETALPASRRPQYLAFQSQSVSTAGTVFGVGGIILAMVYLVGLEIGVASITSTIGLLVESQVLRTALVRVFVGGLVVTALVLGGRSVGVAALAGNVSWSRSGVVAAGGLVGVVLVGAGPAMGFLGSIGIVPAALFEASTAVVGPTATGLGVGFFALLAVGMGLTVFPVLSGLGLLPTSTAGPRLVVMGLLVATIVGATTGSSIAGFGAAVAAVIVWDVSAFGIGLTVDIGSTPAHREGELVHAAASLLVGGVAFVGTVGVYWLLAGVSVNEEGLLVTAVLAVVATLVVSTLLRG